mmetsp:Transcript_17981/g.43297  ORF Transcript_17981/g.43297 Transcript_17981/m.43297 type:complete len:269 (-) Transcript_17981:158-964(-)
MLRELLEHVHHLLVLLDKVLAVNLHMPQRPCLSTTHTSTARLESLGNRSIKSAGPDHFEELLKVPNIADAQPYKYGPVVTLVVHKDAGNRDPSRIEIRCLLHIDWARQDLPNSSCEFVQVGVCTVDKLDIFVQFARLDKLTLRHFQDIKPPVHELFYLLLHPLVIIIVCEQHDDGVNGIRSTLNDLAHVIGNFLLCSVKVDPHQGFRCAKPTQDAAVILIPKPRDTLKGALTFIECAGLKRKRPGSHSGTPKVDHPSTIGGFPDLYVV